MKVLCPGHQYKLGLLDKDPKTGADHMLIFVQRVGSKYPGNKERHPGTTSQEVLRALVDRAEYVNKQTPCWQTVVSIVLMKTIIWLYEERAAGIHRRKAPDFHSAIYGDCCSTCGHVGCMEHKPRS